jgi:hypothetical protein
MVRTTLEKLLFDTLCLNRPTVGRSMKARQHLQSLAFLTVVLLAPGAGFLSIVSILIGDGTAGGLIGSPAQAPGETPQNMLAAMGMPFDGEAAKSPFPA